MKKLPVSFYERDTVTVAKELLGKYLAHRVNNQLRIGKIVEVEAYLGVKDLASHSSKGLTKRTKVLFGPSGHAYVYLIYGIYHCINAVTEGPGNAILIRALEPVKNITASTKGPGLLCKALGINMAHNGLSLRSKDLFIADSPPNTFPIRAHKRIGVDYAKHWAKRHLRFFIKDNPFVSRKK